MPPPLLFDLAQVDLTRTLYTREQIYAYLPHRFEFMLLDGVCMLDGEHKHIVAFTDIGPDAWWVRGHVPGRPLFPGVLMLEIAAQTTALAAKLTCDYDDFISFGGVQDCKFREAVVPPARLHVLATGKEYRPRRIVGNTQGVVDGRLVFEATITGMTLR